jgi:hypothetical protein
VRRFREWTMARRSRFFAVTGVYTVVVLALCDLDGVDTRVLGGAAFAGALFAVVYNLKHGHRWDGD